MSMIGLHSNLRRQRKDSCRFPLSFCASPAQNPLLCDASWVLHFFCQKNSHLNAPQWTVSRRLAALLAPAQWLEARPERTSPVASTRSGARVQFSGGGWARLALLCPPLRACGEGRSSACLSGVGSRKPGRVVGRRVAGESHTAALSAAVPVKKLTEKPVD